MNNFIPHDGNRPPSWPCSLNYNSPQAIGLVGWWPFTQGKWYGSAVPTNYELLDLSGFGQHATVIGNPTTTIATQGNAERGNVIDWVYSGNAYRGDYILTTSEVMKTLPEFSVSCWFRAGSTSFARILWWQGVSGNNGWGGGSGGTGYQECHVALGNFSGGSTSNVLSLFLGDDDEGSSDPVNVTTPFTDTGSWHHVVATFKNIDTVPTGELFLDGVSVGTNTGAISDTSRSNWSRAFVIGRGGGTKTNFGRSFIGELDDFRIYDRPLTGGDVYALYNPATKWDLYLVPEQPYRYLAPAVAANAMPEAMHSYRQRWIG